MEINVQNVTRQTRVSEKILRLSILELQQEYGLEKYEFITGETNGHGEIELIFRSIHPVVKVWHHEL